MAWNVINGGDRIDLILDIRIFDFKAQNIFDFIFGSQLLQVNVLKMQKNVLLRFSSVKKGPNDMKPCETFVKLIKIHSINNSAWGIFG